MSEVPASTLTYGEATARLRLVGEAGEQDAAAIGPDVEAVMQPPLALLVVDLTDCRFLEPAGVDLVGAVMGRAADLGAAMVIEGASANVRIILGIAGLWDLALDNAPGGSGT